MQTMKFPRTHRNKHYCTTPLSMSLRTLCGNSVTSRILRGVLRISSAANFTTMPGERKPIVAVAQMRSTADKAKNLESVQTLVKMAKDQNTEFIFLPECCDFVGENRAQTMELSESLTGGQTVKEYQKLAKENRIWMSLGGLHETVSGKDKLFNSHVIINSNGEIAAVYRKLHMFDVVTPSFKFRESDIISHGTEIVAPLETPIGKLGLQICYDVRFAEASIILRKAGAEILTYPSAFAYSTGKAHWEVLMRARAIENQCFVIAAAQNGFHNDKRQSYGHAMIVNPWGEVVASCGDKDLSISTAAIDLTQMNNIRQNMPCFEHRRSDVYSLIPISLSRGENVATDRKFAEHTIPKETIFYESEFCFAFTNLRCVVKGHVLVAPKRSVPRLKDLTSEEICDLFLCVCRLQKVLENIYETTSATVTVQDGEHAGQTVKHVHFHVMPRRKGDFEHNDQIYIELLKLEQSEDVRKNRDRVEMVEEAAMYRRFIKENDKC